MVPPFKYYFYPFLACLNEKGEVRLNVLTGLIAEYLELSSEDLRDLTKSGRVTKHYSRVNYCASYLKKMGLVSSSSPSLYVITQKGIELLNKFGKDLTLTSLRDLPEYISTQINATNRNVVYVKPHTRNGRKINGYFCNINDLRKQNPNIERTLIEDFRKSLTEKEV